MKKKIGLEIRANGKINLFLDVVSRADDGFHEIKSIMQSVSLCDKLVISAYRSKVCEMAMTCNVTYVPCDERNIVHKAAMAFFRESGINASANVTLNKRIPVSGGMAGGSADCAATLVGLNKLFGGVLTTERLYALGASLGSDVPFCLMGKTALCEGRGEILTPLENRARLLLLIVPSSESVSTPWAYGRLDEVYGDFSGREATDSYEKLTAALKSGNAEGVARNMYNIFEDVILPEKPLAKRAKELMLEGGAVGAMMSGSGPTTFGIFADEMTRQSAAELLRVNGYFPKIAESIL